MQMIREAIWRDCFFFAEERYRAYAIYSKCKSRCRRMHVSLCQLTHVWGWGTMVKLALLIMIC